MTALVLAIALAVGGWLSADPPPSALGQQPTVNLSFSMRGDRARGWPIKTKVALASPKFAKEWTIERDDVRKPVTLQLPAGTYTFTIKAEHHRLYTRELELDKDVSLPEIALGGV